MRRIAGWFVAAALPALAQTVAVYPTGVFPADAVALKAALDAAPPGAVLLLKATNAAGTFTAFNLGDGEWPQGSPPDYPTESIRATTPVQKQVVLRGELLVKGVRKSFAFTGADGPGAVVSDRTVVYGGYMPLVLMSPDVTVENLRLDGAAYTAIALHTGGRMVIRNNVITNVLRRQVFQVAPYLWAGAIYITSPTYRPGLPAITGPIVIENNELAMGVSDAEYDYAQANGKYLQAHGMKLHQTVADMRVTGNTLRGDFEQHAIYFEGQSGHVLLSDNYIEVTQERPVDAAREPSVGILVTDYPPLQPPGSYAILGNTVICHGSIADGIMTQLRTRAVPIGLDIMKNRISMTVSAAGGAISIGGMLKQVTVAQNRVDGSGLWAIALFKWNAVAPTFVAMQANNIAQYSASLADVIFRSGADYNTLIGHSGVVIDEPPNAHNVATGFTKKAIGPAVSAALDQIIAAKQAMADLSAEQ